MAKKVLIVGINSFLGTAICRLIDNKNTIIGVYNRNTDNISQDISAISIDTINSLKGEEFETVYLIGAYVPGRTNEIQDEKLIESNLLLPQTICSLFPAARIIFSSSVSVYENWNSEDIITIDNPPVPNSKYALSKLWGELTICNHDSYAILRISSMYGRGMRLYSFLPQIIKDALHGGIITLYGDGKRRQNYIHVNDVAKMMVAAAGQKENRTFLAVGNTSYQNIEMAQMIINLIPAELVFKGQDHSKSFVYDNRLTLEKLGISNLKNIEKGLEELIVWIKRTS